MQERGYQARYQIEQSPLIAEIAETQDLKITLVGPVRAKLIKKGMISSPAHGMMPLTVPLFNAFTLRALPEFSTPS